MDISIDQSREIAKYALEILYSENHLEKDQNERKETSEFKVESIYFYLNDVAGLIDTMEDMDHDCY